jgi:hypothetical protein
LLTAAARGCHPAPSWSPARCGRAAEVRPGQRVPQVRSWRSGGPSSNHRTIRPVHSADESEVLGLLAAGSLRVGIFPATMSTA